MPHVGVNRQESRPERATVMLTEDEKKALRYVAGVWGTTESDVLRSMRPGEVVAERDRIREVAGDAA